MGPGLHKDWLLPDWPAPAGVRAVCTTRAGGVSPAPYASLNLGDHVGDWGYNVMANRSALRRALVARPVYLRQVHGHQVATLTADAADGTEADAAVTREANLACTIMVADCLPLLMCTPDGSAVGAAHAGWRGLVAGVIEACATGVAALGGCSPAQLLVWLGPCIGPDAFEVGDEVRAAFVSADPAAAEAFRPHVSAGKWLADLPMLARQRLRGLGVMQAWGNDGSAAWCTVSQASRFFSHRRDRVSGRMAACIWRV